jgi:multisubunit Na+/H+ antiporter MnhB subunit
MNVWQFLDRRATRRQALRLARIRHPRTRLKLIDARGWVGIGVYGLSVMLIWMMAAFPELLKNEFFKTIATLIIGTAFVNGVVSWAYSATKAGGELADRNAKLVEDQARANPPIDEGKAKK